MKLHYRPGYGQNIGEGKEEKTKVRERKARKAKVKMEWKKVKDREKWPRVLRREIFRKWLCGDFWKYEENYLISSYPALYAKCDKEKKVILYIYLFKKCKQKNEIFQCFDSPDTSFQLNRISRKLRDRKKIDEVEKHRENKWEWKSRIWLVATMIIQNNWENCGTDDLKFGEK